MSRKKQLMSVIETGDILLIDNKKFNIISKGIQWFTSSRFNHTALYIGDGEIAHYTIGGARKDKITKFIKKKYGLVLMRYEKGLTETEKYNVVMEADIDTQLNKGYDYKSYIGYSILSLLKKVGINWRKGANPTDTYDEEVCSSAIDKWYSQAGMDLFEELGANQVTPEDIYKCTYLEKIYDA